MTLSKLSAILVGLAVGAACGVSLGCASALDKLAARSEQLPTHRWIYVPPETKDLGDTALRLKWAAGYLGIKIGINEEMDRNELGTWVADTRQVWLNKELELDAQVQVLAHELAHALSPPGMTEQEREVFAEAVSYLVVLPEKDDLDRYATYVARHKTIARQVIKMHESHIWWAVKFLRMEGTR